MVTVRVLLTCFCRIYPVRQSTLAPTVAGWWVSYHRRWGAPGQRASPPHPPDPETKAAPQTRAAAAPSICGGGALQNDGGREEYSCRTNSSVRHHNLRASVCPRRTRRSKVPRRRPAVCSPASQPAKAAASEAPRTPGTVTANSPPWCGDGLLPCKETKKGQRRLRSGAAGSPRRRARAGARGRRGEEPSAARAAPHRLRARRDVKDAQVRPPCGAPRRVSFSARAASALPPSLSDAHGGAAERRRRRGFPPREKPSPCAPKQHAVGRFTGSRTAAISLPVSGSYCTTHPLSPRTTHSFPAASIVMPSGTPAPKPWGRGFDGSVRIARVIASRRFNAAAASHLSCSAQSLGRRHHKAQWCDPPPVAPWSAVPAGGHLTRVRRPEMAPATGSKSKRSTLFRPLSIQKSDRLSADHACGRVGGQQHACLSMAGGSVAGGGPPLRGSRQAGRVSAAPSRWERWLGPPRRPERRGWRALRRTSRLRREMGP